MQLNLQQSLKMLDIEQGGIFPEMKRSIIENNSFLIISYGGTGGDALEVIKDNLKRHLDPVEMERCVRLLAIDTDASAQQEEVPMMDGNGQPIVTKVDRFTGREFFWLDNGPARQAVELYNSDRSMQSWINPKTVERIRADTTTVDGSGASGTRQLGRVMLYPQQTVTALQTRITTLVNQITNGNANRLRVMIVSGISGGTGSGIVVDATYLIRHFISNMPGNMAARADYLGFLLLPPTGKSNNPNDIQKGDRNGIAALKEIDHFMTIANRGEQYVANMQNQQIVSNSNIFTNCYLIDGVFTGYAVEDPRAKANEVVSDCILDMMTSQPAASKKGRTQATVDSFMSDASTYAYQMVTHQSEHKAPRSANYVYCAIGHGKTLIPIDLMKAYVAKMVFDKIYALYHNAENVSPEDVSTFVEEVKVRGFSAKAPQAQINAVREAANRRFANPRQGPYFTINLMKAVAQFCTVEIQKIGGRILASRASKEADIAQMVCIHDEALRLNNKIFETYTRVLSEMGNYLRQQHGILCDSRKMQTYSGSTYTFSPIDFGGTDEKSVAVQRYLTGLVSRQRVEAMASALVNEMINHRAEWTQLSAPEGQMPRFDAGERIRAFWAEQVGKIVSSTIEDYLVKYYSGDPGARVTMIQTPEGRRPDEMSESYLKMAAKEIVAQMLGSAGGARALAEMQVQILPEQNFNGHNIFLVPASAPNLRDYIELELAEQLGSQTNLTVDVLESFADDRLSCYSQYTGIPAYMFTWVRRAEPSYEQAVNSADNGLHMSETKGGDRWQDYPNLLPEGIWDQLGGTGYANNREKAIAERCRSLFARSQALGLTMKNALATSNAVGEYTMYTLPAALRPDTALFKGVDNEQKDTPAWNLAAKALDEDVEQKALSLISAENWASIPKVEKNGLKDALANASRNPVSFESRKLSFVNSVMTPLVGADGHVPEGWDEKLAAELLRQLPAYMFDVRGTVLVLERVYAMVEEAQKAKENVQAFAHFLAADLFSYDPALFQWNYLEMGMERPLWEIDYTQADFLEKAKYFFMFGEFQKKAAVIRAAVGPDYTDKATDYERAEAIRKINALKARAGEYLAEVEKALAPDRTEPDQTRILTTASYRNEAKNYGYDSEEIVNFYRQLAMALKMVPQSNFKP